jgi:hypothetical protein
MTVYQEQLREERDRLQAENESLRGATPHGYRRLTASEIRSRDLEAQRIRELLADAESLRRKLEALQEAGAKWVTQPDSLLHMARCEHGPIVAALLRSAGGWWTNE